MRALSPAFTTGAGFISGFARPRSAPAATDFAAARTSVSVTRPSGPVPRTLERSMPSSAATRRATGDALTRASSGFSAVSGCSLGSGSFFSAFGGASFFVSSAFGASVFSSFLRFAFSSSFTASFASGLFSFYCFFSSLGACSPSPPIKAILSPTFTLPPSST